MKSLLISFFLLSSLVATAQSTLQTKSGVVRPSTDLRLNIFLPGAQMRYQDTGMQSQELVTHYTYSISGQVNRFLLGFEYLTADSNSGNQSFEIEQKFSEMNLFLGYIAIKKDFLVSGQFLLEFMLTPEVILGRSRNVVETRLLGTSNSAESTEETSYGIGLIGSARTGYLLVETDFRHQTSKNYEPSSLMLSTVRIGANFQF